MQFRRRVRSNHEISFISNGIISMSMYLSFRFKRPPHLKGDSGDRPGHELSRLSPQCEKVSCSTASPSFRL